MLQPGGSAACPSGSRPGRWDNPSPPRGLTGGRHGAGGGAAAAGSAGQDPVGAAGGLKVAVGLLDRHGDRALGEPVAEDVLERAVVLLQPGVVAAVAVGAGGLVL